MLNSSFENQVPGSAPLFIQFRPFLKTRGEYYCKIEEVGALQVKIGDLPKQVHICNYFCDCLHTFTDFKYFSAASQRGLFCRITGKETAHAAMRLDAFNFRKFNCRRQARPTFLVNYSNFTKGASEKTELCLNRVKHIQESAP